ncbi:hypothetical protein GQ602_007079 [Ophiocordyceps camponoti-floridani]|uniref:Uncharacterized protein n=1 Tax=Ophiocordyceps camponoti-floridani TaxID=2030778 RepID=A0A8H4Q0Q9_9HYPO|nr:hypothetical protein GQ602_007079 [Ophiocordyceps camponoti-floridani]
MKPLYLLAAANLAVAAIITISPKQHNESDVTVSPAKMEKMPRPTSSSDKLIPLPRPVKRDGIPMYSDKMKETQKKVEAYSDALKLLLSDPLVKEAIKASNNAERNAAPAAFEVLNKVEMIGQNDAKAIVEMLNSICLLRDSWAALQKRRRNMGPPSPPDKEKQLKDKDSKLTSFSKRSSDPPKSEKKEYSFPQVERKEHPFLKSLCQGSECHERNHGIYSDHQKPVDANLTVSNTSLTDCRGKRYRLFSLPINFPTPQPDGITALTYSPPKCDCKNDYWHKARDKIVLVRDTEVCSTMSITNCGLIHGAKAVIMFPPDFATLHRKPLTKRGVQAASFFDHNGQHLPLGLLTPMEEKKPTGKLPPTIDTETFQRLKNISSETTERYAPKKFDWTESRMKLGEERKRRFKPKPEKVL